jgi:predicted ATPase
MPADTIHDIRIQGFKSIASIDVELKPINVVIGANGSGKSNFIGAFAFLREIDAGRLRGYVAEAGRAERILHFGSKTTAKINLRVSFKSNGGFPSLPSIYDLTLAPTKDDGLFPSMEEKILSGADIASLVDLANRREADGSHHEWVREHVDRWQVYHLHDPSSMRKTASLHDNRFLRRDGSNLAAHLYYLREKHEDSYSLIVRTVQRVAPFFDNFELNPVQLNPDTIQLAWRHKRSDQYFGASSMSDGTLRFIALATLFLQPPRYRSSLILVDEPELGLHPYAIELLAALIRQAAVDTQVIVSTQSSLLLDHFEPGDVLVADRVDGATQLTRLDPIRLAKWLEDYSLGQLWKKNEFGGQPVPG